VEIALPLDLAVHSFSLVAERAFLIGAPALLGVCLLASRSQSLPNRDAVFCGGRIRFHGGAFHANGRAFLESRRDDRESRLELDAELCRSIR